jgi:5-(carboxyamino)imidazole ribonucleotide synthase
VKTARNGAGIVPPGSTIGILGGGQLGRMIALEGRRMGYRFITLDPTANSPCGQVSDREIVASYDDVDAARALAKSSDVVTYEFENVDAKVAETLEKESYVPQGSHLLYVTQHRVREKSALAGFGVPVTPFRPIYTLADILQGAQEFGFPCVLKTSTGGYDGKGQWLLQTEEDASQAFQEAQNFKQPESNVSGMTDTPTDAPFVLEQFVSFVKELSVVVARNPRGEVTCFPVAENEHRNHILHMSIVPARVSAEAQEKAYDIATRIAESFKLVGLIAVELFLTADGQLYVNELAPRPHNSGHYTYDACMTSQFEQHVRAICNLPLGETRLLSPVVMVNLLGEHLDRFMSKAPDLPANVKIHLYGKKDVLPKRKMGHINILATSIEEALSEVQALGIW